MKEKDQIESVDIQRLRARIDQLETPWERVAAVARFQSAQNVVLNEWMEGVGRTMTPRGWDELTFLPIHFFQKKVIKSYDFQEEKIFKSSGTTGQVRSAHYIDNVDLFHHGCRKSFESFYGDLAGYRHLFFLPFYQANPHSSLLSMTDHFMDQSKEQGSRYVVKIEDIPGALSECNAPSILWTVTFGAMDILDTFEELRHPDLTIIETGGSKGQRKVLPRAELHQALSSLGTDIKVSSEYGMCELSHQAYYRDGVFKTPRDLMVCCTELDDPFHIVPWGKRGRICFIDLGNLHSCSFIETEDMGIAHDLHSFDIIGRVKMSDLRGCNLMYRE